MARDISLAFALGARLQSGFSAAFRSASRQAQLVSQSIREMEQTPTGRIGAVMAAQRDRLKGLSESLRGAQGELARLRQQAGRGELPILVFMHFPPVWNGFLCRELIDLMHEYGVQTCYFGHIHGVSRTPSVTEFEGIRMVLCSADYLKFAPRPVMLF